MAIRTSSETGSEVLAETAAKRETRPSSTRKAIREDFFMKKFVPQLPQKNNSKKKGTMCTHRGHIVHHESKTMHHHKGQNMRRDRKPALKPRTKKPSHDQRPHKVRDLRIAPQMGKTKDHHSAPPKTQDTPKGSQPMNPIEAEILSRLELLKEQIKSISNAAPTNSPAYFNGDKEAANFLGGISLPAFKRLMKRHHINPVRGERCKLWPRAQLLSMKAERK